MIEVVVRPSTACLRRDFARIAHYARQAPKASATRRGHQELHQKDSIRVVHPKTYQHINCQMKFAGLTSVLLICGMTLQSDVRAKACQSTGMSEQRDAKAKGYQSKRMPKQRGVKATGCHSKGISQQKDVKAKACHSIGMAEQMDVRRKKTRAKTSFSHLQFSLFEGHLARKLHFHIFHCHSLRDVWHESFVFTS